MEHDLIIAGGTIVDGTGAAPVKQTLRLPTVESPNR